MDERDSLQDEKEVAYYSAVVEAWVATQMEKDRTLLSLSAGGIGLLTTLLTTVGPASCIELLLYIAAGTFYAGSIFSALFIFKRNSLYLEEVVKSKKAGDDRWLFWLDWFVLIFFMAGVVFTGVLGVLSGYNRI